MNLKQVATRGRLDSLSQYGEGYQEAVRGLEEERRREHARAIADMMNIRIQDVVLESPEDGKLVEIYKSDEEYDSIIGEAVRNVLEHNGATREMFSEPSKTYDEQGVPASVGQGYAMEEGTLIVNYRPAEQDQQHGDKPPEDWRVFVSFHYNPLRNYIPKK